MEIRLRRAFKEWAVVCRALAQGRQILILRKGGIEEGPGGFEVTDPEFLLFPTYLHQSAEGLIPEWRDSILERTDPSPEKIPISHYARVSTWFRIESLEKVRALRNLHIWSDPVVEERFHRWSEESVLALLVRVYALPGTVLIEPREAYGGCKSWISLAEPISLEGARPVLPDGPFERMLDQVRAARV